MDELRAFATRIMISGLLALITVNCLDDMVLGNRWEGPPVELYGLVGVILGGLFTAELMRVRKNGKEK